MSDLRKIIVDGKEVEVPAHYTLLQAAEEAGAEIPRFCFHERLSIAGNCRMCLIEVKGGPPKPAASCAMGVRDLRPGPDGEPPEIMTKTPGRPGATSVIDAEGRLVGFFTDGDLRRLLTEAHEPPASQTIDAVMTDSPHTIAPDTFAMEGMAILRQLRVDQLPVVDEQHRVVGLLDVQDLLDLRIG